MGQTPRELTPYASLRHFFGAELRLWRLRAGLSHDRLGTQINFSGDLIGKVEKAERAPTTALAQACDEVLGTGGALSRLVSLIVARDQDEAARAAAANPPEPPVCGWLLNRRGPTVGGASARGADSVNRFEFVVSVFGAGAGSLLGSGDSGGVSRLGPEDVMSWRRRLSRLYELEAEYGGGVYELALLSLQRLRRLLHQAGYDPSTGEALQTVAGELTQTVGWLAFDAGLQAQARHWWLDASHTARLLGDDRLFVSALRLLAQQATDLDRPREAVDLTHAALRAAKPWATPRLRSNLLAREAVGHARAGDERAAWQAFHQAETLFGAGPRDDDPPWLYFWDEADLVCQRTRAAQFLGQLPLAERSSCAALTAVRPGYPRNRASYLVYRAEVLVKQRSIDDAVTTATQAVVGASEVSSARVDARLGRVRAELARYSDQPEVAEFLDWSGQIMTTKANGSAV